ncbi:RNA polymerase subunit sigma-70 [Streptococcus pyogenes]|uniref:RNA polymerase subunit sigma-70 n=1 Tax=Streptococcus pyogenes TaxID=1314 RepID=UPI000DA40E5F|nr:RNA polymerase subunit sigma-70 [Streptococcus pyogenes]WSE60948.1 RNA polymerase subunit sigma-70 [Streptococcus pyogenes]SQF14123.1 Zinc-finger protein [Streptococcus pyogenes]VGS55958.1 Zinc-finger protein [Streptococcus pyogenes]VGS89141.1 Zinc-finger protein [Streptococcus pyogenes]VGT16599.1 Zinc-finger protein [Streptococcus pyogenes]
MNVEEKNLIRELREKALGYKRISGELGISVNTIKSFCRNHKLTREHIVRTIYCKECGKELIQKEHTKKKIFCSDACKRKWWNGHRKSLSKTTMEEYICLNCHKKFKAYVAEHRKYCCHSCYIKARFQGGDDHE